MPRFLPPVPILGAALLVAAPVQAQNFRFTLRAEPDVIAANGISTTSIFVQLPQSRAAITENPVVRFATTAGVIENQAQLSGGVARVLLRSSTTPGTATVTAFIGNARETISVEFSSDNGLEERYLEVAAPYVAYGQATNLMTTAGKSSVDFGDLHIESDVRLDVDLQSERLWAQGNKNGITIRYGKGDAVKLQGDRLFYDLRRRRGVMRRGDGDTSNTPSGARQEFIGSKFEAPPQTAPLASQNPSPALLTPPQTPLSSSQARENLSESASAPINESSEAIREPNPLFKEGQTLSQEPNSLSKEAPQLVKEPISLSGESNSLSKEGQTLSQESNSASQEAKGADGSSTVAPGSLADAPAPIEGENATRATSLVSEPKKDAEGTLELGKSPNYAPLKSVAGRETIVELPPPNFDATDGYWVTARRLRVFPRDKVQFERASIYYNGKRAYSLPLYVLALDGSFDPLNDVLKYNSSGGLEVKFPLTYMASRRGTGTVFLRREQGAGFGTREGGASVEIAQQYWLSPRSHGTVNVDQLGQGAWNLNLSHNQQLDARTNANFFLNMPRHRDIFARAGVSRDLRSMQIGLETFYDQGEARKATVRGQFFARMRPKSLGKSGWSYTVGANLLGVNRVARTTFVPGTGGGGIGIPGGNTGGATLTDYRSLVGQTLSASFQSPTYKPWRGADLSANVLATAFNYSDGRRGLAPGVTLGLGQALGKNASLRLDYTYDRSSLGLYGATGDSFTHYLSANLGATITPKLGFSAFASRSLSDKSLYGSAGADYFFAPQWRAGLFADYSNFDSSSRSINYGWTLGRAIGSREITVNYDAVRGRVYFELGQGRY